MAGGDRSWLLVIGKVIVEVRHGEWWWWSEGFGEREGEMNSKRLKRMR